LNTHNYFLFFISASKVDIKNQKGDGLGLSLTILFLVNQTLLNIESHCEITLVYDRFLQLEKVKQ